MSSLIQSLMGTPASASTSPQAPLDIQSPAQSNPFSGIQQTIQQGKYEPGTMLNFIQQLMGGRQMASTGGIPRTDEMTGTASSANMSPTPTAQQKQPGLAPVAPTQSPYASDKILPSTAIPAMRNMILTGQSLNANEYAPDATKTEDQQQPLDPNSLAGRMSGPNSKVDMQRQRQESLAISDQFGRKKTSGTIKAQPQKQSQADGSYQVAGDYQGKFNEGSPEYKQWDNPGTGWTSAVRLPDGMTPEQFLKTLPDGVEGATLGDNPSSRLIYLRNKANGDGVPMSQNQGTQVA